ncbi:MAG: glycosyltransferase family 87 protein [Candidatus Parcubacteria bacterium]|nr:glycosyltransferase family 87 protein [Candidatus Parcubacteria bacterium]
MKKIFPFLSVSYILVIFGLFLYSYTQVDLNLTLSQWSIWQVIQKWFQNIGWFQRPLSTALYTFILFLLVIHYFLFLWLIKKNKLSLGQFWRIVIPASIILLFAYNAFSYDLFNYMFDARIVTYHHQDPYIHKALDYPQDPWINFMRWTHRTYPYGPVWLWLTAPLSFIGMQFFLPTFFLFKALMVGSFLGTVYFIGKILEKISPENKMFGMAFFALNPLVIIESLVSGHNDIVMMFFAVFSLFLLLKKRYVFACILLFLSIGIKFATVFLLPVFALIFLLQIRRKKIDWDKFFQLTSVLMIIAVIAASIRTNFQPWYLLYVLPIASLIAGKHYIFIPSIIISFFALLIYIPFLYLGNWDPPVPSILFWMTTGSILFSIILVVIWFFRLAIYKRRIK